ncbi:MULTISPECIES: 2Fe-2S iron-sulfur cluster-binding protein [Spongiibacter]|mgnify:FL=1|jgi:2Fe-2S ferredoxin|uniref:2Fe-2S iron-sulfur cluster-binding protein n=1 Tax=Spongiibacter TaxID=630749 RepID=UPI00041F947B|nr:MULTISPECIES: 2Fe-2S iron-sulfur cluster-binding protein [Spongiibacter]MAK43759.1 (2Fe-2S)-binding protein [Spongiibacter sp.]MBM7423533.1 2Fe-2S ferredoxin [Spongiibacter marinus]MEE2652176.1 2Fe-2S iron-sulfur cluster-binding protein [Pseudomonadota bacterium]
MPLITFISHNGEAREVEAESGHSLMQAALDGGIDDILAECGGSCSCATCHCYIDEPWRSKLPAADDMEQGILDGVLEPEEGSRLSCQIEVRDDLEGMEVRLPASQY